MRQQDPPQTIAQILPRRLRTCPERTALQWLGGQDTLASMTYRELHRRAGAFAAALAERGAGPGSPIALAAPNCPDWPAAYYGIFRLGGVAVPVEHDLLGTRPQRIAHSLAHAEVEAVICLRGDREQVADLAPGGAAVLCVDAVRPGAKPPAPPSVEPGQVAQILYTSGTTGPKKGVALTHRNVIFNVAACCRRFGVDRAEVLPGLLPYHHAYPLTTTVVLPAWAGARMVVGNVRDRRTRRLLPLCRPTVLVGVPRVFESMLRSIESAADRAGRLGLLRAAWALSHCLKGVTGLNAGRLIFRRLHRRLFGGTQLRFCISGGARISPRLLRGFFALGIPVLQGWGMSELSPVGAAQPFSRARFYLTRHYERKAGSIGTELAETTITLRPPQQADWSCDGRERGEMVVDGPHLMSEYHKDPERTRRQMTPHGIRSGDIARRDEDGDLYVIGRVKHVIVLPNGKKVFPEEDLQEELSGCPSIESFAVRAVTGGQRPGAKGAEEEGIGIIVRPDVEELQARGVATVGEMYEAVKQDINRALAGKPNYLRQYDFCLTEWRDDQFADLVSSSMGEPSPLRNPFTPETTYSRNRHSSEPVPWATATESE